MKNNRRAFFGLLLALIGIVLLLDNLNIIYGIPRYLFTWPSLFIVIALFNLISGNRGAALLFGSIGGFFMLERYMELDFRTYWPVILIIIGLSIMLRRRSYLGNDPVVSDNYFDDLNVFGGSEKRFTSQHLEGGKITNVFGGSDIDLRGTSPVDGATIEVFTMFGGCNILVPPHWNVSINTTSIFGGFTDKRDPSPDRSDFTIYVRGITLFGGGELKSSK